MAERGVTVDHPTLHSWVIRLVSMRHDSINARRIAAGKWMKSTSESEGSGNTFTGPSIPQGRSSISSRPSVGMSPQHCKAIRHHGEPEMVTIDNGGAYTAVLTTINADNPR